MISVIIPVYNAEKYIERTIESVLNQTRMPYEVILINDGSTDKSVDIINKFVDKNPIVKIFHQENAGPSIARNHGVKKASGEWICFVDADDMIHPQRLQIAYAYRDGCDAVVCGYTRFHKEKELDFSEIKMALTTADTLSLSNQNVLENGYGLPRMLMRKNAFEKTGGLDEELIHNEDHEFHFRMLTKGFNFRKVNLPLYFYREHNTPHRIGIQKSRVDNTFIALYKMVNQIPNLPPHMMEPAKKILSNRIAYNALKASRQGSKNYKKHIEFAKKMNSNIKPYKNKYLNLVSKSFGYGNLENMYSKLKS